MYDFNAYINLVSAVLGVCFSLKAVISEKGNGQVNAMYMFARSLALACASSIPVWVNAPGILAAVTAAMLVVQAADCVIGVLIKNKLRTVGPFMMAACHAVCLGWNLGWA